MLDSLLLTPCPVVRGNAGKLQMNEQSGIQRFCHILKENGFLHQEKSLHEIKQGRKLGKSFGGKK